MNQRSPVRRKTRFVVEGRYRPLRDEVEVEGSWDEYAIGASASSISIHPPGWNK